MGTCWPGVPATAVEPLVERDRGRWMGAGNEWVAVGEVWCSWGVKVALGP